MKMPFVPVRPFSRDWRVERVFAAAIIARGSTKLGIEWEKLKQRYAVVTVLDHAHDPDSEGRAPACRLLESLSGTHGTLWQIPWSW